MNAHQRRKLRRKEEAAGFRPVKDWHDLATVPDSETHRLEIDLEGCYGWVHEKGGDSFKHYLSTHTFYGSQHRASTMLLRRCGFRVTLDNWDAPGKEDQP